MPLWMKDTLQWLAILATLLALFWGCSELSSDSKPVHHDPVGDCPSGPPLGGC
jgi:hypothetical protein